MSDETIKAGDVVKAYDITDKGMMHLEGKIGVVRRSLDMYHVQVEYPGGIRAIFAKKQLTKQ